MVWGEGKRHKNCNAAVRNRLNGRFGWCQQLRLKDIQAHLGGHQKLYFCGTNYNTKETLLYIDIDVDTEKQLGTIDGGVAVAEFLENKFFAGLYVEPSSRGQGRACYVRIKVEPHLKAEEYNRVYKKLEAWLKRQAEAAQWNIKDIEVKGMMPEVEWQNTYVEQNDGTYTSGPRQVKTFKSGLLAKMPSDTNRFQEWLQMPLLTLHDLERLVRCNPVDVLFPQPQEPVAEPQKRETGPGSRSGGRPGSCSGKHVEIQGRHRRVAEELCSCPHGPHRIPGLRIVKDDVATFLAILEFCSLNMNEDGSMPWARTEALWTAVYQAGDTNRAFNWKRFSELRNWLSTWDLLEWEDNTYVKGSQAAKWQLSEELLGMLKEESISSSTPHNTVASFTEDYRGEEEVKYLDEGILPLKIGLVPVERGSVGMSDIEMQRLGAEATRLLRASWASLAS